MRWIADYADQTGPVLSWRAIAASRDEALLRSAEAVATTAAIAGRDASGIRLTGIKSTDPGHHSNVDWMTLGSLAEGVRIAMPSRLATEREARDAFTSLLCADPAPMGHEDDPHVMILATSDKGLSVGTGAFCVLPRLPVAKLDLSPAGNDAASAIMLAYAAGLNLSSEHKLLTVGPARESSATLRATLGARYRSRSREGLPAACALLRRIGAGPIADRLERAMDGTV